MQRNSPTDDGYVNNNTVVSVVMVAFTAKEYKD